MDYNNEPPKIVFEGEEFQQSGHAFQASMPKVVQWVIKYSGGYIKDEKQANYFLIGFVVVAIIISIYLAIPNTPKGTINHRSGDELLVPGVLNR